MTEDQRGMNPKLIPDEKLLEYHRNEDRKTSEAREAINKSVKNPITSKEILEEKTKESSKEFEKPDLLLNIQKELKKKHLGNEKEQMLTFVTMCSSQLRPKDRVTVKIRGGTSIGKTDMVISCLYHIPKSWFINATRITRSSLEDDTKNVQLIIILEKSNDLTVNESLKQLSEDGMEIWKKDPTTNKQSHEGFIPRKSVIDTSTSEETDEEVANRALIIHIGADIKRFQDVIDNTQKSSSQLEKLLKNLQNEKIESWIKRGLSVLDSFDDILIPGFDALPVKVKHESEARLQRDVKRFQGLIKTIAWLNQKNRKHLKIDEYKILVAAVEDICWAQYLSNEAFVYSISGLSPQMEKLIHAIDGLFELGETESYDDKDWIPRQKIQTKLGIKTENTIKKRVDEAKKAGFIETYRKAPYQPQYVRRTDYYAINNAMIPVLWNKIYQILKPYQDLLISTQLIPNSYHNNTTLNSAVNTCLPCNYTTAIKKIIYTSYELKNITYNNIIKEVKSKLIAENNSVEKLLDKPIRRPKPIPPNKKTNFDVN